MLFTPLKPMLAITGKEAFDDVQFIFEPQYDGGRILIHKRQDRIEAYTRYGQVVTVKFPELLEAAKAIQADTAILDCEGICLRDGRPIFDDFNHRGRLGKSAAIAQGALLHPATFVAFDVLYSEGREHLNEPLTRRKERLADIVMDSTVLTKTMYIEGQGRALFDLTKERGLEGIVAKRRDSAYRLDFRSSEWLSVKHVRTVEAVILGYRTKPFALVIGLHFRSLRNKPVGTVADGLSLADKQAFLAIAEQLHTEKDRQTDTQWIEPRLCCQVDYLDRTDMHQLRTTYFRGFLPHKRPEDCVWPYN
ncbi:bifunctional non-homologous end joining protein LigD [Paenibacillus taihuensis]|uniref:Bifunctional non-homologous end joining protein LigD n=1 Tax=Paenibacillus taihuensis TaxID=1156355 RepID=A0A3D9Q9T6_9BACL|nr:DNA ligase [Paenibacillus taihuensis]REE57495.1 bifunctional non-homologous end joining protein LigD [Paenibacillus taihuensis]